MCLALLFASCGDSERCFECTLNATVVDVCESNYKAQAARDNIDVNNLDEYLNLVRNSGFDCIESL